MLRQDLYLVIGLILVAFAVPSILGAMSDRRAPRIASVAILVGGALVLLAVSQHPGGYELADVPQAFIRVVAYFFP